MATPTQKHRQLAFIAIGMDVPITHEYTKRFLEFGIDDARDDKGNIKPIFPITARFAQALADLEEQRDDAMMERVRYCEMQLYQSDVVIRQLRSIISEHGINTELGLP